MSKHTYNVVRCDVYSDNSERYSTPRLVRASCEELAIRALGVHAELTREPNHLRIMFFRENTIPEFAAMFKGPEHTSTVWTVSKATIIEGD